MSRHKYFSGSSQLSSKNSVVRATRPLTRDFYFGFSNTSSIDGVYIEVEVTALVAGRKVNLTTCTTETKNALFDGAVKDYQKESNSWRCPANWPGASLKN